MARMRADHDAVLGKDAAVCLQTTRINTNVGTMREGNAAMQLYGPAGSGFDGIAFHTEGCVVWDGNFAIHRNAELWPQATEFIPERWLIADSTDPLHPPRNAYRPFEQRPRNGVGQHLVMKEMKIVLALAVRKFDLESAWDEWDALRENSGKAVRKATVWGERLYQVNKYGPPHIKDGMPVHVRVR